MRKIILFMTVMIMTSIALAQAPTLVKLQANDFVRLNENLQINSIASDPDGDRIQLICGSASRGGDICTGSFAAQNPSCTYMVPWSDNTLHTIYCFVRDEPRAGYAAKDSDIKSIMLRADNAPPSVSVTGAPSQWQNTDASANVQCTDSGSGCGEKRLRIMTSNEACSQNYNDYQVNALPHIVFQHQWLCAAAKDNIGNIGFSTPTEFKVDKLAPTTSILCNGAACDQEPKYYTVDVTATLTPQDTGNSGVKETRYTINGSEEQVYSQPIIFTQHGHYTIEYWSVDNAGNAEGRKSVRIFVNKNILTQDLVVTIAFAKIVGGKEVTSSTIKIRNPSISIDFFAYMSCYTVDKITRQKVEDCSEGKTKVTKFDITTKTGVLDYITRETWSQSQNWDSAGKRWRLPIDTIIYQSGVDGCADHDGVPGCSQNQFFPVNAIMPIKISYPDVQNFLVPTTITGAPNFTRSMPINFDVVPRIVEDDGSSRVCNGDNCVVFYSIDTKGVNEIPMQWNDFENHFNASPPSNALACDQYHMLFVRAGKTTQPDLGLQNETNSTFFISCVPRVTVNPLERRLVAGDRNVLAFNVTVWNPLEAQNFDLSMTSAESNKQFVLEWLSFRCESAGCSASDDTTALSVDAVSSKVIFVDLSIAGKSGVFPIKFMATSGGKSYEAQGTLQIFAEGLSEFGSWQLAVAVIALSIFIWRKPKLIYGERKRK
jgi:hypothetical protein